MREPRNGDDRSSLWTAALPLPMWARLIATLGFPIVVAGILLAVVLGWIRTPLAEMTDLRMSVDRLVGEARKTSEDSKRNDELTERLLRQICRNTAKSEFGSDLCGR